MTREELARAIQELGLDKFADELQGLALPCLHFTTAPAAKALPATVSKVGGDPDLPAGLEWPTSRQGTPMIFLARIVEADLRRIHSQARGHLSFFGTWEYAHQGRVICVDPNAKVRRHATPEIPEECLPPLQECSVTMQEAVSLPSDYDPFHKGRFSPGLLKAGSRKIKIPYGGGAYHVETTAYCELVERTNHPRSSELGHPHRLFGYPLYTQSNPAEGAEQRFTTHFSSAKTPPEDFYRKADRWLALLGLFTDHNAGLAFHDTGSCGFLITRDEFAAGDFSNCSFYQDD
jgi:hypothetical protein